MNITVFGGGAWGTTLAQTLSDNSHDVIIKVRKDIYLHQINELHRHPFFGNTIPTNISATTDIVEAIDFADVIVLCVPTKNMRDVLNDIAKVVSSKKLFINVSKGIEPLTKFRVSQLVDEIIPKKYVEGYVVLSGPSHAEEVIDRKLTCLVSASKNEELAKKVQLLFSNGDYMRVYTSCDVIGVETGGAIKNPIAVISGIATGIGLGENARAALISRGVREIIKITEVLGGKSSTAYGLSGIGDLIVTASSKNSRNFIAGLRLGQGESPEKILSTSKQTVEGFRTCASAYEIGQEFNLDIPLINTLYNVLYNSLDVQKAIEVLMRRKLKSE